MRNHELKAVAIACMLGAASIGCGRAPQQEPVEPVETGESEAKLANNTWYRVCWEAAGLYTADQVYASNPPIPVSLSHWKTFHAGHKAYQYHQVWFTGSGATSPAWYSYTGDNYGNFGYIRTAALCPY